MLKCADCDENNPQWGSINRGVVLCDDCSSVHRHLGRHVSQVKHLTKSRWRKTQLAVLKNLAQSGANKYWEHLLLESFLRNTPNTESNRLSIKFSKPLPTDPIHPKKNDFIKEKYLFFGFFKKPRAIIVEDLNQQLHASVRTGFLETSLYLLTLGARPNYQHPTRKTSPLHVATMYNQPLQVELLLTYGADLLQTDGNGETALQIAHKKSQSSQEPLKWQVLITCLLEAQFEITDNLSYFLCRQTIDHSICDLNDPSKIINNFLIPKLSNDKKFNNKKQTMDKAKSRIQCLPNDAFVDLCIDVCDEIDRRDTNDSLIPSNKDLNLYFLPLNPNYSPTRNQGRQKLARLTTSEFRILCNDVLVEASLRLSPQSHLYQIYSNQQRPQSKKHRSSLPLGNSLDPSASLEEHDPVYDQVAADGDYAYVLDLHRSQGSPLPGSILLNVPKTNDLLKLTLGAAQQSNSTSKQENGNSCTELQTGNDSEKQDNSVINLHNHIDDLTGQNKLLQAKNLEFEKKLKLMESQIAQLKDEKSALIVALSNMGVKYGPPNAKVRSRNHSNHTEGSGDSCEYQDNFEDVSKLLRYPPLTPVTTTTTAVSTTNDSSYDSGSDRFSSGPWLRQEILYKSNQLSSNAVSPISVGLKKNLNAEPVSKANVEIQRVFGVPPTSIRSYDKCDTIIIDSLKFDSENKNSNHMLTVTPASSNSNSNQEALKNNMHHPSDYDLPPSDEVYPVNQNDYNTNQVVNIVQNIILQIRSLIEVTNGKRRGDFLQYSRAIQAAVQHLVRLFSSNEMRFVDNTTNSSQIFSALRDLLANSRDLRIRCEKKTNIPNRGGLPIEIDTAPVIQHAHEIARAAKILLTNYQHEEN